MIKQAINNFPEEYRYKALLGVGGMGLVFLVKRRNFNLKQLIPGISGKYKTTSSPRSNVVAIKTILPYLAVHEINIDRFEKEVDIGEDLKHLNIVKITGSGTYRKKIFIEMEYIKGRDLKYLLEKCGSLPISVALYIILEVCKGLDYAHTKVKNWQNKTRVVIHSDLSPSNILISESGEVKIGDFGLAEVANESFFNNDPGGGGKFGYTAPEVFTGDRESHPGWDVYSCGVVLHEMLTGNLPTSSEMPNEKVTDFFNSSSACQRLLPIIDQAVAHSPKNRFGSIAEFSSQLQGVFDSIPLEERISLKDFIDKNAPDIGYLPDQEILWKKAENHLIFEKKETLSSKLFYILAAIAFTLGVMFLWPLLFGPKLGDNFEYHVAYGAGDGKKNSLWLTNPDGTGRTRVKEYKRAKTIYALSAAPGGNEMYYMFYETPNKPNLSRITRKGKVEYLTPTTIDTDIRFDGANDPTVSPDGKWIAFTSHMRNMNGWGELYTMGTSNKPDLMAIKKAITDHRNRNYQDIEGHFENALKEEGINLLTKREALSPEKGWELSNQFSWSPDSGKICFESAPQFNRPSKIWVMNRDGTDKRMIHQCRIRCTALTWSPTGLITFTDGEKPKANDIYVINPDGSGLRPLVATKGNDTFRPFCPDVWLKDGTGLIYRTNISGNYDIWQVQLFGGHTMRLTDTPTDEIDGTWGMAQDGVFFYRIIRGGNRFNLWSSNQDINKMPIQISASGENVITFTLVNNPRLLSPIRK